MLTGSTLLKEIDRFLDRFPMSEGVLGAQATSDRRTVGRLRAGRSCKLEQAQGIMRVILLAEIDAYMRLEQITEVRLSELALGDKTTIGRIRRGAIITPVRAERLLAFVRLPHPAARATPRLELIEPSEIATL